MEREKVNLQCIPTAAMLKSNRDLYDLHSLSHSSGKGGRRVRSIDTKAGYRRRSPYAYVHHASMGPLKHMTALRPIVYFYIWCCDWWRDKGWLLDTHQGVLAGLACRRYEA